MIPSEKFDGDEEAVKELCLANGLSYEKIAQDGGTVTSLEVFFSGFPRMAGLSSFPRLRQLTIVGQSIDSVQALECCPLLSELWVVECQLKNISGLQNCLQLQNLYLYDNQISKIENLELLINLQVLWLNNNDINCIEGMNTLKNLKDLNLADNNIETIGHSLDPNVDLHILNLSGNRIMSFKELTFLAALPHLSVLGLKDPQSSPNPVCLLCNYATHVLYHMPGLQRLDTYEVSSKQVKEAAESTVMKKMMYYNMRVRAAQRSFAETQASLTARKKSLLRFPGERIKTLNHALENLQCELSEVPASDGRSTLTGDPGNRNGFPVDVGCDPTMRNKILRKMEALRERVKLWHRRLEEIESWCEQELSQTANRKESRIRSLLIELETVGNIHFEEVCSTDPGFASYHDLMQSRFSAADYKAHGITGIKINSVIRIHNRALKIRFEDKLHSLLAGEESTFFSQNYKRWLEYLFYVPDPERAVKENETSSIPEEGFVEAEKYKAVGREGAVPLTTSLRLAEGPRMESALRCARRGPDGFPFRHGHVIISKVFLGRSSPVREGAPVDISNYPKAHSVYRLYTVNTENGIETNIERPSSPTMHSGCECSLKQSQWFVFDHELVLPEYIVHFEYISQHHGKRASPDLSSDVDHPYPEDIALDTEALNTEPVPRPRPMMLGLDERTLLEVARANVLSQITVLNLHGTSLNKLKEISRLTALRHLTISFNELTRLDDISHMPNLEFVDASYNHIVTLEGLKGLGGLKQLDLRWNKLSKTRKEVAVLKKHTPALLKLDTRHNDWHRPDTVRMTALNRLTGLTHLDGDLVSEEEVAAAVRINAVSKMNQASLLANSLTDSERPRCLSLLSTAQLLCRLSPAPRHPAGELAPDWAAQITALNLDGQGIHKLTNLEKLINLRWASFNDNDISKLEGLENCLHLEELSLNDNCITKMDGLSKLCCLTKLSLDGNQLSCLEASVLDSLPNLHFLSVENNCIASMNGIQRARTLFELYISNNRITTTRDIYHLKLLTNLVILELYGNPLVEKLENYRIYTVFHLPALKALDGITVEVTESKNAKDVFGGRLTPDMVAEKLGHSNYSDIIDLSLQGSSIRMVDLAPADLFHNLHSVNLEHNSLTSFSGLVYLPNIKALCLNYNHIESILPRQRSQSHLTSRQVLYHRVNSSGYGQPCLPKSNRDAVSTGSLEPLMGSLEVLHLSHNCISNMANLQLSRLSNLKALFLQGNEISQVEGLEGLSRLRKLVLDKNRIKAVGQNSFAAQNILLELHLAENRIRELNHLEPLTELRRLFLGLNKLQDISELVKLEVLPSLTELSVVGNPVARRSLHRPAAVLYLSRLQVLDGMMVTLEERTRAELLCAEPPCPGASVPSVDISAARLLPLVPQNAPPRATGLGAGLQSFLGRDFIFPCILDEAQTHDTSKYKKQKPGSASPRGRAETPLRYIRRTGSGGSPCAGLLPVGNRVIIIYPDLEHGSGFQNGGGARKPSPM